MIENKTEVLKLQKSEENNVTDEKNSTENKESGENQTKNEQYPTFGQKIG